REVAPELGELRLAVREGLIEGEGAVQERVRRLVHTDRHNTNRYKSARYEASEVEDRSRPYRRAVCRHQPQRQADEEEPLPDDVLEVVQVLVVREPALGARAVRRVLVRQIDEVGRDRLDAEDLHSAVGQPVDRLGGDPAEAVEEGGRAGRAVVVVRAEEDDVALAQL